MHDLGGEDAIAEEQICHTTPPVALHIEPLSSQHATAAARLHIEGQTDTFLSTLGPDVLEIVYETLPRTDGGFGFAATVPDSEGTQETVAGFVSATNSVGDLFITTGATQAIRLLPKLLSRFVRCPTLLGRSLQTALYPFIGKGEGKDGGDAGDGDDASRAELLSIMVDQRWRSRGIGAILLKALLADCATRGVSHLDVTVDATNDGARRFYERHGFVLQNTFRLYGRDMCSYGRRVELSSL